MSEVSHILTDIMAEAKATILDIADLQEKLQAAEKRLAVLRKQAQTAVDAELTTVHPAAGEAKAKRGRPKKHIIDSTYDEAMARS
jgi:hypothetical protein